MRAVVVTCLFLTVLSAANAQEPTPTPARIREEVTVTVEKTETRIGDTPASVFVVSRKVIETSAAPTVDDTLRQSVGFSIFRRSSSRSANPTTQGVSLRGVGASGASRSVVLFDEVPLNDPFGGWIQWNRVPAIEVESVEILRGGASSLYGDSSLSGAVNIKPRLPEDKYNFSADVFGGTQKTISGSAFAGLKIRDWIADAVVSNYQTRGFVPVEQAARGSVDSFAGVRSQSFSGRVGRSFNKTDSIFLRPSYFGEVRTNGSGVQTNRTHIKQLIAGGEAKSDSNHNVNVKGRIYGGTQVYDQTFSTINAVRTTDLLNRVQRSPAQTFGLTSQLSAVAKAHTLLGGFDFREVRGSSDEIAIANGRPSSQIGSDGREKTAGVYFQDFVRVGDKLVLAGSLRYDHWSNDRALTSTTTLATRQTATSIFPDRSESAVSPQTSGLYRFSQKVALYGSVSRSFRSPTLNELYRAFRVGNVLTTANENLKAERATNTEGGARFSLSQTYIRTSVFWTDIDRAISNVTLTTTSTLITRQRQNAGRTRSRGFEVEGETSYRNLAVSVGYLFADSTVTQFASNSQLVGLMIPQVARHHGTAQIRYSPDKWIFSIQGRAASKQYDDDLNQFRLEPYAQIDFFASRQLNKNLRIYTAVENVFNSRYSVGKTPIRTISAPALLRVGFKWN